MTTLLSCQKKKKKESEEKDDLKNDDNENEAASSLLWMTQQDFVEYFCNNENFNLNRNDDDNGYNKQDVARAGLFVLLYDIGVFWNLSKKLINNGEETVWSKETMMRHIDNEFVDVACVNNNYQTLYHIATACNNSSMFEILLEIDNECEIYKDSANRV